LPSFFRWQAGHTLGEAAGREPQLQCGRARRRRLSKRRRGRCRGRRHHVAGTGHGHPLDSDASASSGGRSFREARGRAPWPTLGWASVLRDRPKPDQGSVKRNPPHIQDIRARWPHLLRQAVVRSQCVEIKGTNTDATLKKRPIDDGVKRWPIFLKGCFVAVTFESAPRANVPAWWQPSHSPWGVGLTSEPSKAKNGPR